MLFDMYSNKYYHFSFLTGNDARKITSNAENRFRRIAVFSQQSFSVNYNFKRAIYFTREIQLLRSYFVRKDSIG